MVSLRRRIHRHPELAFHERNTAQALIADLRRLGIEYSYAGEGSGVVGRLHGDPDGPTIAIRSEMDALPCIENTGLPYTSLESGKMHACGHDAHMAMIMGAAALLKESPPPGNVIFIFQPAEEFGGGSRTVIESGEIDDAEAIFGGHVSLEYETGSIMVAEGPITAQSDRFDIHIVGEGGHGARPHEAIDAIVIAGLMIATIQTLVSREIDPMHPSVVTVGKVDAGTAANVIAEEARLSGTIRTTLPGTRNRLHEGLHRICTAMATLHSAEVTVEIAHGYPPVVNTPRETLISRWAIESILDEGGLIEMEHPSMGAEDFSYYLEKIPGCFVRFGARSDEMPFIPLHSSSFVLDENVLRVGATYFDAVVREAIRDYRS